MEWRTLQKEPAEDYLRFLKRQENSFQTLVEAGSLWLELLSTPENT